MRRTELWLVLGVVLLPVAMAACPASDDDAPNSGVDPSEKGDRKVDASAASKPTTPTGSTDRAASECEQLTQRIADRDCPDPETRRDPDPECEPLVSRYFSQCGKQLPPSTQLPLPPEQLANLSPTRLCDFEANMRGLPQAGPHAHCVRGHETAIELFGQELFQERARCWLSGKPSGRPTVLADASCGSALQFPTLPDEAEQARATAAVQPWCAAESPECFEHGRCTATVVTWEASELGGVLNEAGARVRCSSSLETCSKTPRCEQEGWCSPDSLGIGCVIASKADCAQSKACTDDGRCKFKKSEEEGWMGESMTRCVK